MNASDALSLAHIVLEADGMSPASSDFLADQRARRNRPPVWVVSTPLIGTRRALALVFDDATSIVRIAWTIR